MLLLSQFILLIICANGAPIVARHLFSQPMLARPIDAGIQFLDKRPLLGPSKTWRGLLASLIVTSICALFLGFAIIDGAIIAVLAMLGDLCSSFIKRRLNIASSDMAIGLDQIPESLLPLMYAHFQYQLSVYYVCVGVLIFFIIDILISRILYRAGVRKRPY